MVRHKLSDESWNLVADLMPTGGGRGRPWNDHRRTLDAIFWIQRTGAPWRDLPECCGAWQSVYDRFNRWSKDGTLDRLVERLHEHLDEAGRLDREIWCIDGSSARATRAAAGAGKKGEARRVATRYEKLARNYLSMVKLSMIDRLFRGLQKTKP